MNIPFLGAPKPTRNVLQGEDEEEPQYPGTFIPPHQLSQHDGHFMFSLSGRERLRARNAILKSTGFLEHTAGVPVQVRADRAGSAGNGTVSGLREFATGYLCKWRHACSTAPVLTAPAMLRLCCVFAGAVQADGHGRRRLITSAALQQLAPGAQKLHSRRTINSSCWPAWLAPPTRAQLTQCGVHGLETGRG